MVDKTQNTELHNQPWGWQKPRWPVSPHFSFSAVGIAMKWSDNSRLRLWLCHSYTAFGSTGLSLKGKGNWESPFVAHWDPRGTDTGEAFRSDRHREGLGMNCPHEHMNTFCRSFTKRFCMPSSLTIIYGSHSSILTP